MTDLDLNQILANINPLDNTFLKKARERTAQLVMPTRALGRLHDISERLCAINATLTPSTSKKAILIMAGDHGVTAESVSAYPQEVTGAMVQTFLAGGAAINALARQVGADVRVVDMGIIPELSPDTTNNARRLIVCKIAPGTANLATGPAMTRSQAENAIITGFEKASELFDAGLDLLGTGDMGIGNTTPSAAIGAVLTDTSLDKMVGRGTGVDNAGLELKKTIIKKGIAVNRPNQTDGLDVLAKVGGFEIGGIAGCFLAGAYQRKPVIVDGFISTAGALVAQALCPIVTDYLFSGHCSAEAGHRAMLRHLKLEPIFDLGMRLGEGTGAALAMGVLDAAVSVFKEVMTFDEAGVPGKDVDG